MANIVYTPDNLPNGMIGLSTPMGQEILQRVPIVNDLMVERFRKQIHPTYCGPASLAVLINALNLAYRVKYMLVQGSGEEAKVNFIHQAETGRQFSITEDDIVNQTDVRTYLSSNTDINHLGLDIHQVGNVASILGLGVSTYFACGYGVCDSDEMKQKLKDIDSNNEYVFRTSLEFKRVAADYIRKPVTGVIINYSLTAIGYQGLPGHFSPLAAYDQETDRFLVMDVWFNTPPAWVKTDLLFKALSTIDNDSNLPRGMLHIHELV